MSSNKNIVRRLTDRLSGRKRIRVVLLGSKGTGKTVFMTSVGNHLMYHEEDRFNMKKTVLK